jgi:hypothetical protein
MLCCVVEDAYIYRDSSTLEVQQVPNQTYNDLLWATVIRVGL